MRSVVHPVAEQFSGGEINEQKESTGSLNSPSVMNPVCCVARLIERARCFPQNRPSLERLDCGHLGSIPSSGQEANLQQRGPKVCGPEEINQLCASLLPPIHIVGRIVMRRENVSLSVVSGPRSQGVTRGNDMADKRLIGNRGPADWSTLYHALTLFVIGFVGSTNLFFCCKLPRNLR